MTADLDEALAWLNAAKEKREPLSVGLVGNAAAVMPELVRRGITPDVLTDQTSAHDTLNGYVPLAHRLTRTSTPCGATTPRNTSSAPWSRSASTCGPCWH